jgi:nitrilase
MKANITVGIAQFRAFHLELDKNLQKLESIVKEAHAKGVNLLVFGESWLSGYPAWLDHCPNVAQWDNEDMKDVYFRLHQSSISVPGKDLEYICNLARKHKIILCIGINERVEQGPGNGTLYNSVLLIDENGILKNHHRKLMPTFTEKMVYGLGDGSGLNTIGTPYGRIGASICWEHWMPLTRQVLHDSGEDIHIALWPTVHEMHQIASRHYAFEGRCFVVAVGQLLKAKDFPVELTLPDYLSDNKEQWVLRGGSCIIDPTGKYCVEPVFDREDLIICEINTNEVIRERMTLDTSGHYQRRDIFDFQINRRRF